MGILGGGIAVAKMQGADSELGLKDNFFYAKQLLVLEEVQCSYGTRYGYRTYLATGRILSVYHTHRPLPGTDRYLTKWMTKKVTIL